MPGKKSKLMRHIEETHRQPLESLLCSGINAMGMSGCAEELGVSKATLGYWCLKLGIEVKRVALLPGETVEVRRT